MKINVSQTNLFLLYYINENLLYPVNKLINKKELDIILTDFSFNNKLYSLPYLFFIDKYTTDKKLECYYQQQKICDIFIDDIYDINYDNVAMNIFLTKDINHPGVNNLYSNKSKLCVGGYIKNFNKKIIEKLNIPYYNVLNKEYKSVFQSRNPPHRAHENIISKYSQNGKLLYSTPFSTTNKNDYSFDLKIKCYEEIKKHYNIEILVTLLPRVFAGPREALQNLLLFQNIGCETLIMGRGKNCIGDYYTPTQSYEFCKQFNTKIKIEYQETQFVNKNEIKANIIKKDYISKGILPPNDFMSDYIARILINE